MLKMWLPITFAGNGNFSQFDSRFSVLTLIVVVRWSPGKQRRQVTCFHGVPSTPIPHNTASLHMGSNLLEAEHCLQCATGTQGDWLEDQSLHSVSVLLTFLWILDQQSSLWSVLEIKINQKVYGYGHWLMKYFYRYCWWLNWEIRISSHKHSVRKASGSWLILFPYFPPGAVSLTDWKKCERKKRSLFHLEDIAKHALRHSTSIYSVQSLAWPIRGEVLWCFRVLFGP